MNVDLNPLDKLKKETISEIEWVSCRYGIYR